MEKRGRRDADVVLFLNRFDRFRMVRLSLLLLLLSRPACSMLLGWVDSPGYPTGYLPHASLNWSRCAPKGHTLSIKLIHLDLEDSKDCENDAVKVFSNGNLISVLCGKSEFEDLESNVNPSLLSSPGGCLSLTFHSDYSNTKRHTGFRGFYTDQDFDECNDDPDNACTHFCHNHIGGYRCSCRHGYYLDVNNHTCTVSCTEDLSGMHSGDISSPSWPASYAENANCQHTLSVEPILQLELHFSEDFDVEQSPDGQCIDALNIETLNPSRILGPFCGHNPPPSPLLTHSHHVKLRFTSDGYGSNKGFTLHFKTRDKVCPAVVTPYSTVTPQQPDYHQGQTVTVTCDLGYILNSEQDTGTEYVARCLNTGEWTPNSICEPVDCGFPEIPEDGILQLVASDKLRTQYQGQIQFTCSSLYYTLEGDGLYTCSASGDWVSEGGKKEMPKCVEVCGKPEKHPASVARILGGKDASMGEIPWILLIKSPNRGGASLINDRWAVTAAHVVEGVAETSLRMYGGLVDGRTISNVLSNVAVMDSEKIIIHPNYITGSSLSERTNFDNDIALIRLASRVNFAPNLLPICLPDVNKVMREGEQGTVSGWGSTESKASSPTLKYAHIGAYSLAECENTPSINNNRRMTMTTNMFCAGAPGKDSCQRDSGSPLVSPMLAQGNEPYYLTGIVSWGPPCKERQYKGYYTKVASYVDWIKETMDQQEG
ncbi:c1s [Pungitius sinensis]